MDTLRQGSSGSQVRNWQMFLRGRDLYLGLIDGDFGRQTHEATSSFQLAHSLRATGCLDNETLAAALLLGFELLDDHSSDKSGPNWPEPPIGLKAISQSRREDIFGVIPYRPSKASEAIFVDPGWINSTIVKVPLPTKQRVLTVDFHRLGVEPLRALFDAWNKDGLIDKLLTFDGSFVPRCVRGSRSVLSSHAWGTAFDINARWNALGATPALIGRPGCVRELVGKANELGFWWGGHYSGRRDGMHFELVRL